MDIIHLWLPIGVCVGVVTWAIFYWLGYRASVAAAVREANSLLDALAAKLNAMGVDPWE